MQVVYQAESIIDAHLVRHALEDAGIACHILGEALSGGIGELPASGLIAVAVLEEDWPEAREVVDEVSRKLQENGYALDDDDLDEPGLVTG